MHTCVFVAAFEQGSNDVALSGGFDMAKLFDGPVYLEVWIKVKGGWADNEAGLRAYGYE